ncbi:MAG: glycoside hydrolase family 97 catalytic domain-containing protein, partial [Alistipes sp.]|nr:glycoside hydrolase family 97 catalytic domain-containing protein [Candidatus Minthomonas equi]
MKNLIVIITAVLVLASCAASSVTVSSPDGHLDFHLSVSEGQSVISIDYKGEKLLLDSPVGIDFENGYLGMNVKLKAGKSVAVVDDYYMPVGKTSHVHSVSNELVATLRNPEGLYVKIFMRAFDDGVAYRYEIPAQKSMGSLAVKSECMELKPAGDPVTKAMILPGFISSHEANYKTAPLSAYEDSLLMDMPVFLAFPSGKYMAVTEANVVDYAGMMIRSRNGMLTGVLSPRLDDSGLSVIGELPHRSPWRVFLISDRAGALLESNILTTLCDPCQEQDLSWLNPGKATWPWWCGYQAPAEMKKGDINTINYNINTYFIDFCAKYGIPYHSITGIIDENGREYPWFYNEGSYTGSPLESDDTKRLCPGFELEPICRYAEEKGVDMRVWVHWKPLSKDIEGTFRQYRDWGIKGMMIDYMDRDDQEMIDFQKKALELGMKYHLHIQFHGSSKPSGLQRTYPCEFTRENTLNYEVYKWNGTQLGADHDLDLPFTRCLAGPADYHLGGFNAVTMEEYKPVFSQPMVTNTR